MRNRRALGIWVTLTLVIGAVAAASVSSDGGTETVASASDDEGGVPARSRSPESSTSTSATSIVETTTPVAPVVVETTTSTPPLPPSTTPPSTAPPTTAPPVTEPPVTAPPTSPSFSMSPGSLSSSRHSDVFHTSGEGCTGPGHLVDEYGVVGIVTLADGPVYEGDRVASRPGGHWDSTMFVGNTGTHTVTYRCTARDGSVLFEYAPRSFTITP